MKVVIFLACALLSSLPSMSLGKNLSQVISLTVTEKGFEPNSIDVKPGTIVTLKVTRKTEATCATQIAIPSMKIKQELPLNKEVTVELGKVAKGEIRFACSMDMISGIIHAR